MVNSQLAEKLIKVFIRDFLATKIWYKNIKPFIKATILYGSISRGNNTPKSDIDIMIVLPLEFEEKYTQGEYFYNYGGQVFNIVLRSIERLRKIAKEQNSEFQKEIFRKSVIIDAMDTEVEELLEEILK